MNTTKATNITWHHSRVTRSDREKILQQKGCTIWLTGLPSSGKSTTAFALEHQLTQRGYLAYVLDGDNIRHGLNKNLGFSAEDRHENIRRIGEVSKLMADSGIITITSFISPYTREREFARTLHKGSGLGFVEVYVKASLETCENRDPKGLYRKARSGQLKNFTGIDDPYEPPLCPELIAETEKYGPEDLADQIVRYLLDANYLQSEDRRKDLDEAWTLLTASRAGR